MIAVRAQQVKPTPKIGVAFAAIPLDVLRARNISPAARLAFAALANHARMRRGEVSTLTNRRLAEAAGLSVAAARRALDELEAAKLVRRLYGPSKRIRVGVGITYQASAEGCSTATSQIGDVAQQAQPGCSFSSPEVAHQGPADLLRVGEKGSESPSLALQESEERKPDGAAAAAYLRACLSAARRREPMPEPPAGVTATKGVHETDTAGSSVAGIPATPSPAPTHNLGTCLPTPVASQGATGIVVGRMVADLAAGLSRGVVDVRRPMRPRQRPKR